MIDMREELVNTLKLTNLPVFIDYFTNKDTPIPCITYMEANNADLALGDTIEYSNIAYLIKIYSYDLNEIIETQEKVDKLLHQFGLKRTSVNEIINNNLISKILRYEGIGYNNINI